MIEANLYRIRKLALMLARPQHLVKWMSDWVDTGKMSEISSIAGSDDAFRMTCIAEAIRNAHKAGGQEVLGKLKEALVPKFPPNLGVFSAIDALQTLLLRDGYDYPAFVPYQERVQQLETELEAANGLKVRFEWGEEYIANLEVALQDAIPPLTRLSGHPDVVELLPRIHTLLDTGLTPKRDKEPT